MKLMVVLAACLALGAALPTPNDVRASVVGTQTGHSTGGGSVVGGAQGTAAAGSQRVINLPGHTQLDTRATNAGVGLQGAAAGNGAFSQMGAVTTTAQGQLGQVQALGTGVNSGVAHNAAVTNAVSGNAAAGQQVAQRGVLANPQGQPVGAVNTNLGLNAGAAVGLQGAVRGTGTFSGTDQVAATAQHLGPVLQPGQVGPAGNTFVGVGTPQLPQPAPPAMPGMPGGMPAMPGGVQRPMPGGMRRPMPGGMRRPMRRRPHRD